ncbi:MAG: N-acetylmuramoyl-L-alanine amidase CwlD, partial [Firmicutes bacterium]|nr:N-acetylmuramoyl-L-alanine amidase CwlD [Bacillota bacterium]
MVLGVAVVALPRALAWADRKAVAALSWQLAHRVVVVDPGHGGIDPGAVGRGGALEKDIALAVATRLAELLRQGGATVLLTRQGDNDLADPETWDLSVRKRDDLARRVDLANARQAHVFLSIHVNSFGSGAERGAQTFFRAGHPEGRRLATAIQREFQRRLATYREPKEADYYVLRNTKMPAVVVEVGFISNPAEERLMQDPAYQTKLAWCIYAGLVRYFAESSPSTAARATV